MTPRLVLIGIIPRAVKRDAPRHASLSIVVVGGNVHGLAVVQCIHDRIAESGPGSPGVERRVIIHAVDPHQGVADIPGLQDGNEERIRGKMGGTGQVHEENRLVIAVAFARGKGLLR